MVNVQQLQLPYKIHSESHGDMSFHRGIRLDSCIDSNIGESEMLDHFYRLFKRSGDNATNMRISLDEGEYPIIHWTMNYGKLSPRDCWTMLEPVGDIKEY